jgi:neutral ceramidase
MFESAEIIGRKQFDHALNLLTNSSVPSMTLDDGPVDFVHAFVNMSDQAVTLQNREDGSTTTATTCRAAMGYAFAAGTTDGPGAFNFHQATNETTLFWQFITDVLNAPSAEQVACQAPKPILLNIGDMHRPYQWDSEVVPVQLLRVGMLFIASVPSEFTTMAGRRLRSSIKQRLVDSGLVSQEKSAQIEVTSNKASN